MDALRDLLSAFDSRGSSPRTPAPARTPEAAVEATAEAAALGDVSGTYRGTRGSLDLELRVDVDGRRPLGMLSGDLLRRSGGTLLFETTITVPRPDVSVAAAEVTAEGPVRFGGNPSGLDLRVSVRRPAPGSSPGTARAEFLSGGDLIAAFDCDFRSSFFRTVEFEEDRVQGVAAFGSYDTASLPSGGPARVLDIREAFAEAGVEMVRAGTPNEVPLVGAGFDQRWTQSELHAAMVQQFELFEDSPQWRLWVLAATRFLETQPNRVVLGIMFDQVGRERQGCAVFHDGLEAVRTGLELDRYTFHTYIHEMGHCLNLLHSFDKGRAFSLSYMNYPRRYEPLQGIPFFSTAAREYWNNFAFEFDDMEVEHLRHAELPDIIPGGSPFAVGSASETDLHGFRAPLEDRSGLRLRIEGKPRYALGEPVVVETKLEVLWGERTVNPVTHANSEFVRFAIEKPSGETIVYEPFMTHCVLPLPTTLGPSRPAVYDSSYLGYGRSGFVFDQIGRYRLRAAYVAEDGSRVVSNDLRLRVTAPKTEADEALADLYLGEDQGSLFYLLGSDHESLAGGCRAFEQVVGEYGDHPLAVYARLALGVNDARPFKRLHTEGGKEFRARPPRFESGIECLSAVVDACQRNAGVDNITANMAMRTLALARKDYGDEAGAARTLEDMVQLFRRQGLKDSVMAAIEAEAVSARESMGLKAGAAKKARGRSRSRSKASSKK